MKRADARAMALRLDAWGAALRALPAWVDASWYAPLGLTAAPAAGGPGAAWFGAALGLDTAPARAFQVPAHRVAALPSGLLCRVLRARGLLRRRPALRHCLDGALRSRLVDWVHPTVFEAVLRESADGLHRDAPGLPFAPAGTGGAAADMLAWEGFCLFERDGVWTDPNVLRMVRLGFPRHMAAPAALDDCPGAPEGSAWVMQRLGRFVEEAPWLCG